MGKREKPRDKRDIYYRKAKEEGWRARSAFKLLQVDEEFKIFKNVKNVVDLCAAPGSWSQVCQRKLLSSKFLSKKKKSVKKEKENNTSEKDIPTIVAVDLVKMAPLKGVIQIQGDITSEKTVKEIFRHFKGKKADLVVCDGAHDVNGMHDLDIYIQHQLVLAALNITTHILNEGGTFVSKIFRGKDISLLYSKFGIFFKKLYSTKPKSSRNQSIEAFLVCKEFILPKSYVPTLLKPMLDEKYNSKNELCGEKRCIIEFVSSGNLSPFDSDLNYELKDNEAIIRNVNDFDVKIGKVDIDSEKEKKNLNENMK